MSAGQIPGLPLRKGALAWYDFSNQAKFTQGAGADDVAGGDDRDWET